MSYVKEQQKYLMKRLLEQSNEISFEDIKSIANACQIASGHATGIGKILGMIAFLEEGKKIIVNKRHERLVLTDKLQLVKLLKSIDPYLDII